MYGRLGYDGVSRKETVVGVSDRQPRLMDVVSEDNPAPVLHIHRCEDFRPQISEPGNCLNRSQAISLSVHMSHCLKGGI